MRDEPNITINGKRLSIGQAVAVRTAIEHFVGELHTMNLGDDLHGRLMRDGYHQRINEVRVMIYGEAPGLAHNVVDSAT